MKKKLLALVLAVFLATTVSISAFAASGFNKEVFSGRQEIKSTYDDMSGITNFYMPDMESMLGDGCIILGLLFDNIYLKPTVAVTDQFSAYYWDIVYNYSDTSFNYHYIDELTIKIGENRYIFKDIYNQRSDFGDKNQYHKEFFKVFFDEDSISVMEDLINHRDEEIKVRLSGKNSYVDFVLPDVMKDNFIHMYNLYASGGGTEKNNLKTVKVANDPDGSKFIANIK